MLAGRFFVINPPLAKLLITKYGYWAVGLRPGVRGFCRFAGKAVADDWRDLRVEAKRIASACFALFLSGIYFQVHEPREFKVLFDEFVISGIAHCNMYFDREATYPERAHYFDGRIIVMSSELLDKRPVLFSVHYLIGA